MELELTGRMLSAAWYSLTRFKPKGRVSIRNHKHCWIAVSEQVKQLQANKQPYADEAQVKLEFEEERLSYLLGVMNAVCNEGVDPVMAHGFDDLMTLLEDLTKPKPKEPKKAK